jgi:predicted ester cyclase
MFEEMINQGNLEIMDELFDHSFVTHTSQGDLDYDAARAFFQSWLTGFSGLRCDVSQLLEDGDRVSWTIRATGTHQAEFMGIPATGRPIDFLSMNYGVFRDGKAIEHWVLMDSMTMLTQLGVIPQPETATA